MNKILVTAFNRLSDDDLAIICDAARLTQKRDYKPTGVVNWKLLKNLRDMEHWAPFEFVDLSVFIQGCSRVFLAQITRHRLASYMSSSQQYQDHSNFDFLIPTCIEEHQREIINSEYHWIMSRCNEVYEVLMANGIDKDDARYVLPNACRVDLMMKANLREWLTTIIPQRICRRNTIETVKIIKDICHFIPYDILTGPACVTRGVCNQGKMCCGKPYRDIEDMMS